MNCQEFELIAGELAEDQLLSAKTRISALAHAESCEHCARRLASERRLSAGLNELAECTASEAPARLKHSLRVAFEARKPVAVRKRGTDFSLSRLWGQTKVLPTLAVAAAVAAIVFAVTLSIWLRGSSPKTTEVVATATPIPTPVLVAPAEAHLAGQPEIKSERRAVSRRRVRTLEDDVYIPLAYAINADAPQDKMVVRVEVSRSTLIGMGLPLNAEGGNELVKADLMVGIDGVPLAIRFIKPAELQGRTQ
jgi:hypothetical protein